MRGHSWEVSKAAGDWLTRVGKHGRIHSFPCLSVDAGCWMGLQLGCQPEHTCVASPCDLGHLKAWQSRGSWTSYILSQGSKGLCPRQQCRSYVAFYDLASEVTQNHFCCILLVISESPVCLERVSDTTFRRGRGKVLPDM